MFKYFLLIACVCSFSSITAKKKNSAIENEINGWFPTYDVNKDRVLNKDEFSSMYKVIFYNDKTGENYTMPKRLGDEIFEIFDKNSNGFINKKEFSWCYKNWIRTIFRPRSAFVVIDVQNDFISGSLNITPFPAKHNGVDVVKPINQLLNSVPFNKVYYSLDWHPQNHVSFIDNVSMRKVDPLSKVSASNAKVFDTVVFEGPPKMTQRLWPKHCVQRTWGAKLHKDLKVLDKSTKILKGTNPDVDSYSVFWDNNKLSETPLHKMLKNAGVSDVYVAGLAYDVCVGASALDAQNLGYRTILIDDCSRGVDPVSIEATKKSVKENHGVVAESKEVKDMVQGKDRRPELGYKLALWLKKQIQKKRH